MDAVDRDESRDTDLMTFVYGLLVLGGLCLCTLYNYLLFHSLAEIFSGGVPERQRSDDTVVDRRSVCTQCFVVGGDLVYPPQVPHKSRLCDVHHCRSSTVRLDILLACISFLLR